MGKLYLVRHGQTPFNVRNRQWHDAGDPENDIDFQYTMEFVDPPLNEKGESQILKNKSEIQGLNINTVYVSPMLRTLQTCNILFGDAENRPRIIVCPFVTEWIHLNHDVPAWPSHQNQFPHFDWSQMPEDYFIKSILSSRYTERLDPTNYPVSLLSIMREILPDVVESRFELFTRAKGMKEKLRAEVLEKNVMIVGHSAFYRHLTSDMVDERTFINQKILGNGEYAEIEY